MGILTDKLDIGKSYWVCELPTLTSVFLYPELRKLTDIYIDKSKLNEGRNYDCTFRFGDIDIPSFLNPDTKFYLAEIDNFLITNESSKMQRVIRNHINSNLYDGKKIDTNLDIKAINEYILDIDNNRPELLI